MTKEQRSDSRLRRMASRTAIGLVAVKFGAWLATDSVALLASAVDALVDIDALVDAGASLVTYFGVRHAGRPPDWDHRFGHGKGEAIAGFTQATFLPGAAVVLAIQSFERVIFPEPFVALNVGMVVIVCGLIAASAFVVMQTWVVKRTGSIAITADRAHYLTDIVVNAGVLAALGTGKITEWERADPAIAFVIAGYIMWNAYHIACGVLTQLLDRELPEEDRQRIQATVLARSAVNAAHDLRTRHAGDRTFVEFHLVVDGKLTVTEGHTIGDAVETAVENLLLGTVEVTTHLEPFGIDDERLDNRLNDIVTE